MATDGEKESGEGGNKHEFVLYSAPAVTQHRTTYRSHVVPIDRCDCATAPENVKYDVC